MYNFYHTIFFVILWIKCTEKKLLTAPKLLNERSISLPAVSFVGYLAMAITRTRQRASLLGKQYQLIVQQVVFSLLPCYVK